MLQRAGVNPTDIVAIEKSMVCSILEYVCQVWHTGLTVRQSEQLEVSEEPSGLPTQICPTRRLYRWQGQRLERRRVALRRVLP